MSMIPTLKTIIIIIYNYGSEYIIAYAFNIPYTYLTLVFRTPQVTAPLTALYILHTVYVV